MSRSLRLFLIALVPALTVLPTALLAQQRVIEYNPDRWVEVSGEGSVSAAPDFARVTLGVTTAAKDAREAMAANAKSANALVQLIRSEGVAPADIQTSGLSISPMFAQQPPAAQANAPTITGYSVSDNVTVIVRDIPRLGALLDGAVAAGANSIYGIGFGENDPSALLDKARPLAVADARRKAEIFAAAGGAESRSADGAYRRGRRATCRLRRASLRAGRGRPDADRGGRGQAQGDGHGAVRTDSVRAFCDPLTQE